MKADLMFASTQADTMQTKKWKIVLDWGCLPKNIPNRFSMTDSRKDCFCITQLTSSVRKNTKISKNHFLFVYQKGVNQLFNLLQSQKQMKSVIARFPWKQVLQKFWKIPKKAVKQWRPPLANYRMYNIG